MDDLHEPRDQQDVRRAYLAAEDVDDWLHDELVTYFGDEDTVDAMLDKLESNVEERVANILAPDALLGVEIRVTHTDDDIDDVLTLRDVPHPVELLWLLSEYARLDDIVTVSHFRPHVITHAEVVWPFGMDGAELLTSPDLRPDEEGDGTFTVGTGLGALAEIAGRALGHSSRSANTSNFGTAAIVLAGVLVGAAIARRRS